MLAAATHAPAAHVSAAATAAAGATTTTTTGGSGGSAGSTAAHPTAHAPHRSEPAAEAELGLDELEDVGDRLVVGDLPFQDDLGADLAHVHDRARDTPA